MVEVKRLIVGQMHTNCYLVWDEQTLEAAIIDPGDDADYLLNIIKDLGLLPKYIIGTHGHSDHLSALTEIKLALSIPFLLNEKDIFLLNRLSLPSLPDVLLTPETKINFGSETLKVITTPGHTPGSVSLYFPGLLFSGDTLFYKAVGRTDLLYSSAKDLQSSLKKLFLLPPETRVLPGHGDETTISEEKNED